MLVIYSDGFYEDPQLGWAPFAAGGVVSRALPGGLLTNRAVVAAPAVFGARDAIAEYLERPAARRG